jgi:putative ABC transport system permease protein
MELFNREGVMEIDVAYPEYADVEEIVRHIKRVLAARHGEEDFTITTQQQMLDVLGSILNVLTLAVGALGGISLVVGGVGVLAIMTISVNERVGEIGLLRALGATGQQVRWLFLTEAACLAGAGGSAGLIVGVGGVMLAGGLVPGLPVKISVQYLALAEAIALTVGLLAGVLPAYRAARLDPIEALRAE